MTSSETISLLARSAATAAVLAAAAKGRAAEKEDKFLADISSDDPDVRFAAWDIAAEMDTAVIPALGKLLAAEDPGVRKAAAEALNNIVHSVGKEVNPAGLRANAGRPNNPGESDKRQQVVGKLLEVLAGSGDHAEKVAALRHLSLLATTDDVLAIAKFVADPKLREEAVFSLERIPGKTSEEALLAALPDAAEDFKPRILAALGHRRAEEAISACLDAMKSPDTTIAMAGMKAAARIGAKTGGQVKLPDYDSLSEWQKTEYADSMLRYADAQVEQGNTEDALPIYQAALQRDEGHWQCAAIIGLAKVGTAEAAAAIFPKLESDDNTVRITAQKAWVAMSNAT
jgi:HEAT repeat protein